MARDPLVVVLLKIPFKLAVWLKTTASIVIGVFLSYLFNILVFILTLVHYRNTVPQCFLSGILKALILTSLAYIGLLPALKLISLIYNSSFYLLLLPLLLAEIISLVYLISKSSSLVPLETQRNLFNLISSGLYDLWALSVTLFLCCSLIGIARLDFTVHPDKYLETVYTSVKFVVINITLIPKLLILALVPWRLALYLYKFNEKTLDFTEIINELIEGIFDLIALFCEVLIIISLLNAIKLWNKHKRNKLTRKGAIKLFIKTIVTYILILVVLIDLACLVRACLIIKVLSNKETRKDKKIIAKVILRSFLDTLLSPFVLLLFLFVLIGVYRLKNLKVSFNQVVFTLTGFEVFSKLCLTESGEQLIDLFFAFLLLVCLPFLHRSIPALKKLKKTAKWHELVLETLFLTLCDIPLIILLSIIFGTLIRVPLFFKRKRSFKEKYLIYLCVDIIKELLKDLLVAPYFLMYLISPWRLYFIFPKLYFAVSPNEQRRLLRTFGTNPLLDYITIILVIVLLLSLWRSIEVISIVVNHIRLVSNNENTEHSLLKKVFKKFLELLVDILMMFFIVFIFLSVLEIKNFCRRIRTYYYLYKDRKGLMYKKYLKSIWPSNQTAEPKNNSIKRLNRNVFSVISSFLDVKSLATVAQVNRKFRDLTNFQPIWKFQYESNMKKYMEVSLIDFVQLGDDYKEMVKTAYENYVRANSGVVLDEEERDFRMGARVIVLEETLLSIFGFPHILALPSKIASYGLSKVDLDWYFAAPRYPYFWFNVRFFNVNIDTVYNDLVNNFQPDSESLKKFYHVQLNFVFYVSRIFIIICEQISFLLCVCDFYLMRILSFGQFIQLSVPGGPPRQFDDNSASIYLLQLLATVINVFIKVLALILPSVFTAKYTKHSWLWSIFGPFCLYVPYYFSFICNVSTVFYYYEKFYNFNPQFSYKVVKRHFSSASTFGQRLYNILKRYFELFQGFLKRMLSGFKIFIPSGTIFNAYKGFLLSAGRYLKNQGYLGDLIFTPLTLVWIFWPLLIPYLLSEKYLLIPVFPIEIFLIIKGYTVAKQSWSE